ncbi:Di-copper centre-containing protein [Rhizoclosmatium globosum]|uniref:Di-copper centre-containing protein n=1 Tax=Rhizoclosmatium globosum TaxID=329046 RepID=A0A1Y2D0T3_9FUNG|nr:Di-copper centre-containing protein [Rhizoclosmatium globosum]|eukprot:ORY52891.1 Di-copper centre-containing protein [Rhizoclosmatium globosum]
MLLGLLVAALSATLALAQQCTNPVVRPEWSTLSADKKQLFIDCIKRLAARPQQQPVQSIDPTVMSLYDFTIIHALASPWAHGSAEFYPYHRAMMWKFEQGMQSVGWQGGVPYWDWSAHNQDWDKQDVWTYFGSPTNNNPYNCVLDGGLAGFQTAVLDSVSVQYSYGMHDSTQCLRRCGTVGSVMTPAEEINSRNAAMSYAAFRGDILVPASDRNDDFVGFHASGHNTFGGDLHTCDMANPSISPNDPIFWLHHAFVDKVWWRWQSRCPAFKYDYEGPITANDPIAPNGGTANPSMQVDSWQVTVAQMLDTQGGTLCYTYSQSGGDLPMPAITCPVWDGVIPGSNPTTVPTTSIDDTWVYTMFQSLVKVKLSFGTKRDGLGSSNATDNDVWYLTSVNSDNSTTITLLESGNKTVTVPPECPIRFVYRSYAETECADGTIKRYHPLTERVPYQRVKGAPVNVTHDDPCYRMHPTPIDEMWPMMHGMNVNQFLNRQDRMKERVDQRNIDRCGPVPE